MRKNIFTNTVSARNRFSPHVMIYHRFQTEYILDSEWRNYWFYNSVNFFYPTCKISTRKSVLISTYSVMSFNKLNKNCSLEM